MLFSERHDSQYDRDMPNHTAQSTLVIGGARSGKSRYAEQLIMSFPPPWTYLATAERSDDEMAARIAEHRLRRGDQWQTLEAPLDLAAGLEARPDATALVDCLTLWLSNLMFANCDVEAEIARLETAVDFTKVAACLGQQ